ncbi:MAG: extracellular solute-binding protein [bacterium]
MSDERRINRRQLLGWAGAAGLGLGLAACSRGGEGETTGVTRAPAAGGKRAFEGQTLRMFIYSGAWEKTFREAFVPAFQQQTGATVILDPGWWDSIPKLKASPPGQPAFDLVLTDATQGYPAIREGLFQQLDMAAIPNRARITPAVLDNHVYRDGYGIPFPESVMTLAYNKSLVAAPPTGWGDLARPEHDGKLGLYNSFYMSLYTFACIKADLDGKAGQASALIDTDLEGVFRFAAAQRDRVRYWWPTSTDMVLNLSQKNVALGNMHSPDILPALREQPALGAVVPPTDRAFVLLMWVVPAGTKQKALAEAAIDYIFGEAFQTALAERGSTTPLADVAAKVAAKDPFWKQIYPSTTEELAAVRYYPYDAYFKDWDAIVARWDREILRKS